MQEELEARTRELAEAQRRADEAEHQLAKLRRQADEAGHQLKEAQRQASEALEQQSATSEVLALILNTSGELEPGIQAMLQNATRICEAKFGTMYLREGNAFRTVALHNAPPAFAEARKRGPIRPGPKAALTRMLRTKQVVHIPNVVLDEGYIARDPL